MRRLLTVLLAGAAGVVVAPAITPTLGRLLRPVARKTVKTGLLMYHHGRIKATELAEAMDDLHAEARAELAAELGVDADAEAEFAPEPAETAGAELRRATNIINP